MATLFCTTQSQVRQHIKMGWCRFVFLESRFLKGVYGARQLLCCGKALHC
jgi:hypothetical protein